MIKNNLFWMELELVHSNQVFWHDPESLLPDISFAADVPGSPGRPKIG